MKSNEALRVMNSVLLTFENIIMIYS